MTKYSLKKTDAGFELISIMPEEALKVQLDAANQQLESMNQELMLQDQRRVEINEAKKYIEWFINNCEKALK